MYVDLGVHAAVASSQPVAPSPLAPLLRCHRAHHADIGARRLVQWG